MLTQLCRWWFEKRGWTIENPIPQSLDKFMLVVAPHTSYLDFFLGVAVRNKLGIDIKFLAKSAVFRWPVGWFLRQLGGYPVNRKKKSRMVNVVSELYASHERFAITITPEGTRKRVSKWKTGFYRIAQKADVPIVLSGLDYKHRRVVFSNPKSPGHNMEKDLEAYRQFFKTCSGFYPERGVF